MENMDPKQVKQMLRMIKENPEMVKQLMAANPALAKTMNEEQLQNGLEMFAQMDDAALDRMIGMMNRVQKVTRPFTTAWTKVNGWLGGHLAKLLLLVALLFLIAVVTRYLGVWGGIVTTTEVDEDVPLVESFKSASAAVATDEFEEQEF
jgi:type III secretory pathway component EscU